MGSDNWIIDIAPSASRLRPIWAVSDPSRRDAWHRIASHFRAAPLVIRAVVDAPLCYKSPDSTLGRLHTWPSTLVYSRLKSRSYAQCLIESGDSPICSRVSCKLSRPSMAKSNIRAPPPKTRAARLPKSYFGVGQSEPRTRKFKTEMGISNLTKKNWSCLSQFTSASI